jgi:predicted GIY-YIG superfamily endonuclease
MIDRPCDLASLNIPKNGIKKCLAKHNKASDFQGCYVLIEEKKPIYVGISREVFRRLKYHIKGKQDNTATLAYSIASRRFLLDGTREQKMNNKEFLAHFHEARSRIEKMQFAFVEIKDDFELYVFEAYVALELDTRYNSFRTH